jgi:dipeptidase E
MSKAIKTIVAIGGGEIGELDTLSIDKKIVALVKKVKPKVLFIPTASNDAEGYCDTFQKVYSVKLHCQVDFLLLTKEKLTKKEIKQKILSADIIYVGGGDTLKMLKIWRKQNVDKILQQAYKKGIILAGISAGAICWFRYGISDVIKNPKNKKLFGRLTGMNILKNNITLSPHHTLRKGLGIESVKEIMTDTSGTCLSLDDTATLVIQNDHYQIWESKQNAKIRKLYYRQNKMLTTILNRSGNLTELTSQ